MWRHLTTFSILLSPAVPQDLGLSEERPLRRPAPVPSAKVRIVHRARHPAFQAAHVAVDSIPTHLAHEAADVTEALRAIELGGPDGILIAAAFFKVEIDPGMLETSKNVMLMLVGYLFRAGVATSQKCSEDSR